MNARAHFYTLYPIATTHVICVFSSLANDTHIVDPTSNVLLVFLAITRGIWSIRTFIAINKVCSLVSTGVRQVYITFSRFFYTWVSFLYFRCSNEFLPSCNFCDAFILLCPIAKLLTMYYIFITMCLVALYQVWCLYHSYVRKVIKVKIL